MRHRKSAVLIGLGIVALGAAALAQDMGLGSGVPELRRVAPGPPAVPSAILVNTGVKLLVDTGVVLMEHN